MKTEEMPWSGHDARSLTKAYIDHVYEKYYKSYNKESDKYARKNNMLFGWITSINFAVTILVGLKEIFWKDYQILTGAVLILPSISSFLFLLMNQRGYKKKEEIREEARIQAKYLVNESKIRFTRAKSDTEFESLYRWLNEEVRLLQLSQAKSFFDAQKQQTGKDED